jgi:hypothetical protein
VAPFEIILPVLGSTVVPKRAARSSFAFLAAARSVAATFCACLASNWSAVNVFAFACVRSSTDAAESVLPAGRGASPSCYVIYLVRQPLLPLESEVTKDVKCCT